MSEIGKQIEQVEKYIRFGETLPTQLPAVKVYLGYDNSNVPDLSPESMQDLFKDIRSHVDLWNNLSTNARAQLRELSITASNVVKNSKGLIRGLDALGPVAQMINTVGNSDLSKDDFEGNTEALDESTLARLNNLQPYIDVLHQTSLDSLGDTDATSKSIANFRTQSSVLEAKVAGKVDKLKDANDDVIGKEKTVGPMIDAFKEARDRIVAQFGEGTDAAKAIQEQIDKTLNELTSREADLQQQQRLTYAVGRLFVHLQGLGYSLLDAQSALTKLWMNSSTTCTRLKNITSNLKGINTEEMLLNFYVDFKKILRDWDTIKEDASNFYKAL